MNIQSFYEYVILRDILAFILPGGISLVGISMVVQAFGSDRFEKILLSFSNLSPFLTSALFIMIAFLIGHILDMLYRLIFQRRKSFLRLETMRKMLIGEKATGSEFTYNPVSSAIRESVGQFLKIDWKNDPIEQWIESGKAFEVNITLAYWIEQEDARLFGNEIGRPIVQSHLLYASGMAFIFLGICALLAQVVRLVLGTNLLLTSDPMVPGVVVGISWLFGYMLIRQAMHKRDIIVEHVYRVFHVLWQKRGLEGETGTKKPSAAREHKSTKK
jgi:hypothetical protein